MTRNAKVDRSRISSRTRLTAADLFREALESLSARWPRSLMNSVGTVVGVAAYVSVVGLTATASGQISSTFSEDKASQVILTGADPDPTRVRTYEFPRAADRIVESLNGVTAAGRMWPLPGGDSVVRSDLGPHALRIRTAVVASSPGYLRAIEPTLSAGASLNDFHEARAARVLVLGVGIARKLGIDSVADQPSVFVRGTEFSVIGIVADVKRDGGALQKAFIPASTALSLYGEPEAHSPATMHIRTQLGSATKIAREAPIALRPDRPETIRATPPPDLFTVESRVSTSLSSVFLILAAVVLVISGLGIANTTLIAVFERYAEFGLRRSIGARPIHVAGQILVETSLLGVVGGLVGSVIGVGVTLATAMSQSWTPLIDPMLVISAPALGAVTGALAGIYPSARAARIQPADALRR